MSTDDFYDIQEKTMKAQKSGTNFPERKDKKYWIVLMKILMIIQMRLIDL
jgi:hypothetical protein